MIPLGKNELTEFFEPIIGEFDYREKHHDPFPVLKTHRYNVHDQKSSKDNDYMKKVIFVVG